MTERAILIFPKFENIDFINEIRKKHDPLYDFIAPHITLVFPFKSNMSKNDITLHLNECLKATKSFKLVMKGITGDTGGYLFLNVKQGNDNIIELHDLLYKDKLKDYLFRGLTYKPHLTIGRINDKEIFNNVLEELKDFNNEFEINVDKVFVEVISVGPKSVTETEISLL